jgi:hypothetical protein
MMWAALGCRSSRSFRRRVEEPLDSRVQRLRWSALPDRRKQLAHGLHCVDFAVITGIVFRRSAGPGRGRGGR